MTSPVEESFTDTSKPISPLKGPRSVLLFGGIAGLIVACFRFICDQVGLTSETSYLGPIWLAIMFGTIVVSVQKDADLQDEKAITEFNQIGRIFLGFGWPTVLFLCYAKCWRQFSWPNVLDSGLALIFMLLMTIQLRKVLAGVKAQ